MKKYIKIGNVCYCLVRQSLPKNGEIKYQYETRWIPGLVLKTQNDIDNAKEVSLFRYYIYKLTWL